MAEITKLIVTIQPFYFPKLSELKVEIEVDGYTYRMTENFRKDDFNSLFHCLMEKVECRIKEAVEARGETSKIICKICKEGIDVS